MHLSVNSLKVRALELAGVTRARWSRRPPGLYVFTFHRVGNARTTRFDPNVFSCTAADFGRIVDFIQREFDVIDVASIDSAVTSGDNSTRAALITFDDGYIDNFQIAMPALAERGLSATFFITTAMADGAMAWWDQIAYWARESTRSEITLQGQTVNLQRRRHLAIRQILRVFKEDRGAIDEKLERYRAQLAPARDLPEERLMMGWEELREASRAGFTIGSHTVNHPIMSHLSEADQRAELAESKAMLEAQLNDSVRVVAFPVGGDSSFTDKTIDLARDVGYDYAFTSISKFNCWDVMDRYRLGRVAIDSGDIDELRYRIGKLV